jgi:hypothetical protein
LFLATHNGGRRVFHMTLFFELHIFQEIPNLTKRSLTTEVVKELLLATDNREETVFHMAAEFCELEVFQVLFSFAKKNMTTEEVNKMLLGTDNEGGSFFHVAGNFKTQTYFKEYLIGQKRI